MALGALLPTLLRHAMGPLVKPLRWWQATAFVLVAVFGSMGVQAALAGLYALLGGVGWIDAAARVGRDPLCLGVSQLLGFGFAFVWAAREAEAVVALRPEPTRLVVYALVAGAALQFPYAELAAATAELLGRDELHDAFVRELLQSPSGLGQSFAVAFATLVVAPLTEELLFRGVLLPSLLRAHGRVAGLVVSALLFALVHGRPTAMVYAFAAGLVLGALRIGTGSVLLCIAMHAATNALPWLLPAALVPIEGVNVVGEGIGHVPPIWLVGGSAIAALSVWGLATVARSRAPDDR